VVARSSDRQVHVIDAASGRALGGPVERAPAGGDGPRVTVAVEGDKVRVLDGAGAALLSLEAADLDPSAYEPEAGSSGRPSGAGPAFADAEHAIRVVDLATGGGRSGAGAAPEVLRGHSSVVSRVLWSPSGRELLSASWDGSARVWTAG